MSCANQLSWSEAKKPCATRPACIKLVRRSPFLSWSFEAASAHCKSYFWLICGVLMRTRFNIQQLGAKLQAQKVQLEIPGWREETKVLFGDGLKETLHFHRQAHRPKNVASLVPRKSRSDLPSIQFSTLKPVGGVE